MIQLGADDGGAQPLLAVSDVGTSYKPAGFKFRQLVLSIRFVISLNRTRSPPSLPPIHTVIDIIPLESEREIKKRRLNRIVKEKDIKALNDFGGVPEVVSFLQSESESEPQIDVIGDFAQTVHGLGFWGSLLLFVKGFWPCLYKSLNSCTILVLVIAADLSFAIGSLEQGLEHGWHDGVGLLLAVFLLVFVSSVSSFYRKKTEETKLLQIKNNLVTVKRCEIIQRVSVFDVKEGEIIHLKKGDHVPADGLLIKGENLVLDEALNSHIDPHQNPFLFSGSVVEYGKGEMVAVSIDHDTAFRKGLLDVIVHPSKETLFQSRINKPYEFIEKFSLVVTLVMLLVVLTRLLCEKHKHGDYYNDKPETKGKLTVGFVGNAFERMFFGFGKFRISSVPTVLLTIVIGIQHGMPLAIAVSLSFWREKMRRSHKVNCHNLSACGTLGLVSVICIDITAELSFHDVEVREFYVGEEKINPGMEFHLDIHQGFDVAARVLRFDPKTTVLVGNNLLNFWENSGLKINKESLDQMFDIIDHKFLSSEKGIGVLVNKSRGGDTEANLIHEHFYGDASTILDMCSNYYDIRGRIHDIENRKDVFRKVIREMEEKGLRSIAFACKQTNDHQEFEGELKLLGLMGLKFSHEKLLHALKELENIGVRIILTSEDELSVAIDMADDLGTLCDPNNKEMEGKTFREIMEIDGVKKNELMKSITVIRKAKSEDKLLLVKELKAKGETVALLGGLTSGDVPTLIEADIGIVQENRSTKVSKLVSDLSCEDVTTLNHTLKYARSNYLNIQKFYQVQLTALISGLLITLICTMVSGKSPITTFHLIWVTLIMCFLGSLMMVMELNDKEVRNRVGDGDRDQSLITRVILKKIVIHVLCQALVFLVLEHLGQKIMPHMEEEVRHTMIFNTFIICQIANLLGAITMGVVTNEVVAVYQVLLHLVWVMISVVGVLAVQVMVIEFDGTIVNGVKLSAVQWIICFLFALALGWASYIFFHFVLH